MSLQDLIDEYIIENRPLLLKSFDKNRFFKFVESSKSSKSEKLKYLANTLSSNPYLKPGKSWDLIKNIFKEALSITDKKSSIYKYMGISAYSLISFSDELDTNLILYKEAKKYLEKSLHINSRDYNTHYSLGLLEYEYKGNIESSKIYFQKALEIKPTLNLAKVYLSHCFFDQKKYLEFLKYQKNINKSNIPNWRNIKLQELKVIANYRLNNRGECIESANALRDLCDIFGSEEVPSFIELKALTSEFPNDIEIIPILKDLFSGFI